MNIDFNYWGLCLCWTNPPQGLGIMFDTPYGAYAGTHGHWCIEIKLIIFKFWIIWGK